MRFLQSIHADVDTQPKIIFNQTVGPTLPILSARGQEDVGKTGNQAIDKVVESLMTERNLDKRDGSRTIQYKVDGLGGGLLQGTTTKSYNNPFKKQLENSRSTSQIVTEPQMTLNPPSKYKNYLPNIIKQKNLNEANGPIVNLQVPGAFGGSGSEQRKIKVISKKEGEGSHIVSALRQDVSYLQEHQTSTQKPTILTTGDRGQDELLEATMGLNNLGKSLINLPASLDDLLKIHESFSKGSKSSIFSGISMADEEERMMEQYMKDHFDPLDALENLLSQGKIDSSQLVNMNLPTSKLSYYVNKKLSPRRGVIGQSPPKHAQAVSLNDHIIKNEAGKQSLDITQMNEQPPHIQVKPDNLILLSNKLMKKYSENAFYNHSQQLGSNAKAAVNLSAQKISNQNEMTLNLFGEPQSKALGNTSPKFQIPNDLGNPSSRQDAVILISWYEKMLANVLENKKLGDLKDDKFFPILQLVMNICIKELTRQVSVQCHERGLLITRLFGSYIRFMELLNADHVSKRKKQKYDFALKLDRYVTLFEHQTGSFNAQISHLEHQNRVLRAEQEELLRQLKDQANLTSRYKKKCFVQKRDQDSNFSKIRYLEKENRQLKLKLSDLKEDFNLDIQDLDDNDRLRLIIEVEREIQDIEQVKQHQKMSTSRTSMLDEGEINQMNDRDIIGQDERETSTEDFEEYLRKINGQRFRAKEVQVDLFEGQVNKEVTADVHDIGIMIDQSTETVGQTNSPSKVDRRSRKLTIIQEDGFEALAADDNYTESENSDSSYDFGANPSLNTLNSRKNANSADQTPNKRPSIDTGSQMRDQSSPRELSQSQETSSLIGYLAQTLVERANQVLEREKQRIEKLSETIPEAIAERLRRNLKETTNDVEMIKVDIQKKQKEIKRSLKQYRRAEKSLKIANDQVDNLEMDNYNLREQINDQVKMLDEYKQIISDLQHHMEVPSQANSGRIKELLVQLNDMLVQSQTKARQLTEDTDNVLSVILSGQKEDLVFLEDQSLLNQNTSNLNVQSRNTGSKHISSQDASKKKPFQSKQHYTGAKRISASKSKGTHPAYLILKKIQNKDPKKLKDIMPRKMLLRVIYMVYQERGLFEGVSETTGQQFQLTTQSGQSSQNPTGNFQNSVNNQSTLIEWVYDTFMQKYGLKNVAERKFTQLISACIFYKDQLHRICLFGRFLEVHNDLPISDYNRYLNLSSQFSQQILNFKFDENSDSTLLPLTRATDHFRFKFEQKLLQHVFNHRLHQIERMKVIVSGSEEAKVQKHLKGVREGVDFDWFAQFLIDNAYYMQDDREQQVKDLFQAIDVSSTGFITLKEFQMVMKLFYYKSSKYIQRVFEEYAMQSDPQNPTASKVLTQDQFQQLALEREFFTPKVLFTLIKSKHPEKDFEILEKNLQMVISLFRARLVQMNQIENQDYLDMLNSLQTCVKYSISSRVSWLCYRLTDETLKRLFLKQQSDELMAVDLGAITGIKLKPSQNLISSLPINYFETQH